MHKGKTAQAAIISAGWKQKEFAQRIGYSPQHLSRELNKEDPSPDVIAAIESGLEIPEGTLFYLSEDPAAVSGKELQELIDDNERLVKKVNDLSAELEEAKLMSGTLRQALNEILNQTQKKGKV
jgi:transcriptional regulator with XRE-family HTH domain